MPRLSRWALRGLALGVAAAGLAAAGLAPAPLGAPLLAVPLFARIGRDQVLGHATRRRILEAVTVRPGTSLQGLRGRLGVAWGTVVHHVRALERHGHVVSVRQGNRRRLFAAGTPQARRRIDLALLHGGAARDIAALVRDAPGIGQPAIARRVGILAPAVSKHLARLAAAGLVTVERTGAGCRYAATPRLAEALALGPGASGAAGAAAVGAPAVPAVGSLF